MPLTPLDAEKYGFRVVMRGYDKIEVEQFRAGVMQALEEYIDNIGRLRVRIGELESEIGRYKETEELLKSSVMLAQKTSDEIISAAKARADAIVAQAHADGDALKQQYAQVSADRERFEHQFQALLTGYLHQLQARLPAPAVSSMAAPATPAAASQQFQSLAPAQAPESLPAVQQQADPPVDQATPAGARAVKAIAPTSVEVCADVTTPLPKADPTMRSTPRNNPAFDAWQDPGPFSAEPLHDVSAPPQYAKPAAATLVFDTAAPDAHNERDGDIADFSRALEKA